ncbi:MAG TPA: hypothetical protein VLG13_01765 [Patescibacteria group bacterium]|nr:hypothetical protein [Patescibacteria group bacterium]
MARQNKKVTTRRKPASRTSVKRGAKKAKTPLFARHRHSFKLLPHKHTSYPLLALLMLMAGIVLSGSTFNASAIDYTVNGRVPAPPITEAAVILSPTNGQTFQYIPIMVSGTCPADSYIKLYRNDFFSGSVLCSSSLTFQIQTDLFLGANRLVAHVFNKTDDEGPPSNAVTVFYVPPSPPAPISNPGPGSSSPPQLILSSDYLYKGYVPGQTIDWLLGVNGGSAPYAVSVDWGDGKSTLVSRSQAGTFPLNHAYAKPGPHQNSYKITIKASDASGQSAFLQLFTVVGGGGSHGLPVIGGLSKPLSPFGNFLRLIWPAYLLMLLVLLSFWLGERREYELLKPWLKLLPRRHA